MPCSLSCCYCVDAAFQISVCHSFNITGDITQHWCKSAQNLDSDYTGFVHTEDTDSLAVGSATAVQVEPSCRLVCNYNRGCPVNGEGCLPQRKESADSRFEQRDIRRGQNGSATMRV